MAAEIMLAIQILNVLTQNAPWVIEMIKAGQADQIDWNALRPKTHGALEAQADQEKPHV